jgi:serine/threonine protein kinase
MGAVYLAHDSQLDRPVALKVPRFRPEEGSMLMERFHREAEAAIKDKDQSRACALVYHCGELGHPSRSVFDLLLRYAISEDGALHAEKYYRTVTEEFEATRPVFRWQQLAALARVTASEYGFPAAGYAEACRLLKV